MIALRETYLLLKCGRRGRPYEPQDTLTLAHRLIRRLSEAPMCLRLVRLPLWTPAALARLRVLPMVVELLLLTSGRRVSCGDFVSHPFVGCHLG